MPTHPSPAPVTPASSMNLQPRSITDEDKKIYTWIMELVQGDRRETALLELSKKREQVEDLAVILWHSVGTLYSKAAQIRSRILIRLLKGVMTSLLQEIISVYPLLSPSSLTAAASNRVCNALALLQCVASHNDTRGLFLNGVFYL
jgi:CCR4-NOT transcription complex subunit 9